MQLNIKFHANPLISFSLAQPQNLSHRQADRHFIKIEKSCSGHLKACKSIKNRNSKIFRIPILSSYIKYRRKKKQFYLIEIATFKYILIIVNNNNENLQKTVENAKE